MTVGERVAKNICTGSVGFAKLRSGGGETIRCAPYHREDNGDWSLGDATEMDTIMLGRSYVGPGARLSSDRKALVSKDGTRVFRFPTYKPQWGERQANFESRVQK
jgi:hypothetical protein